MTFTRATTYLDAEILVLDHRQGIRYTLRTALRCLGYRLFTSAESSEQALGLLRARPQTLLIAPCALPGADLALFIDQVRGLDPASQPAVVLHAGIEAEQHRVLATELNVDGFLAHPFTGQQLGEVVHRALLRRFDPDDTQRALNQAREALRAGQPGVTINALTPLLRQGDQAPAQVWALVGRALLELDDLARARTALELACRLDPCDPGVLSNLAEVERFQGHPDQWCRRVKEAFALNPLLPERRAQMSQVLLFEGRKRESLRLLEESNLDHPSFVELRPELEKLRDEQRRRQQQAERVRRLSLGVRFFNDERLRLRQERDQVDLIERLTAAIDAYDSTTIFRVGLAHLERGELDQARRRIYEAMDAEPELYQVEEILDHLEGVLTRGGGPA